MAKPTIDQIRGIGDFATLYQWNLDFASFPSAVGGGSSEDFNIRCISSEVPKATGSSIEVQIRGHKVKQPGVYEPPRTLTLTFVEAVDMMVNKFFKDWRDACYDMKTGEQRPKAEVEAVILLTQLNRASNPIWQYTLYGVFIEDYDPTGGQYDAASIDVLRPSLTISYDYFEDQPLA